MPSYMVRVHCGPSGVEEYAKKTGLNAGTEHVYGEITAPDENKARELFSKKFQMRGYLGLIEGCK